MHLLTVPGIVKIGLKKTNRGAQIFAQDLTDRSKQMITSNGFRPEVSEPIVGGKLKRGRWYHIGVRYKLVQHQNTMVMELILGGQPVRAIPLPKTALRGQGVAVALNGSCDGCGTTDSYILDEVVLSSTARSIDYFAAGAYQVATAVQDKFLAEQDARTLLSHIGVGRMLRGQRHIISEFYIPAELKAFASRSGRKKARAAVQLGEAPFKSPLLSVDADGVPQTQIGSNEALACASCHVLKAPLRCRFGSRNR